MGHAKAETMRKRLIPSTREYTEVVDFIKLGGPPANNHAVRALRPLVIFRKVCHGTRSPHSSGNIAIFSSLTQTANLQECPALDLFDALLTGSPGSAHDLFVHDSS